MAGLVGCFAPGLITPAGDLTVASLLSGRTSAQLSELPCGHEVSVPLGPGHEAFVALNLQQMQSENATLAVQGVAALRAPSFGLAAGGMAPLAGGPSFETRLHVAEAGLRQHPPPNYHLAQAPERPNYQVGSQDNFWVIADLQDGQSTEIQVPAKAAYVGAHCYVFVDEQVADLNLAERVKLIGQTFDTQIFPTDTALFGEPVATGVNGDPKVTLLISPVVGNYGHDTTIGYFTLRDLFAPGADPSNPLLKHTNQRLMLYISPYVVASGKPADFLGTIAHECQHLINASQKLFHGDPRRPRQTEEVWLDEALAMYAMEANGYGLSGAGSVVFNHVAAYLANAGAYSLVDWQNNPQQSSYGAGYLFATYLADRFGQAILKDLVTSQQVGIANLNGRLISRATNFRQVFVEWTAANLLSGTNLSADPRYNYRTVNLVGTYGGHKLRGMRLDPIKIPTTGTLPFKPYSAQYLFFPPGNGKSLRLTLRGSQSQNFGGLVVSP
jgi:hypothetical protein